MSNAAGNVIEMHEHAGRGLKPSCGLSSKGATRTLTGSRYLFAAFGASDVASFWKRGSFRSGSNIGSSRSSAGVSGGP
jgi:hypothetical protein